jgi:hypothetical protein
MQARMYRSDVNFRKTLGPVLLRSEDQPFLIYGACLLKDLYSIYAPFVNTEPALY